jgi:hypothetical protein
MAQVIHALFKDIFTGLEREYGTELQNVRRQYASEPVRFTDGPCVLHWDEGPPPACPPPPPRTNRTHLVLPPVLSGQVSSFPPPHRPRAARPRPCRPPPEIRVRGRG